MIGAIRVQPHNWTTDDELGYREGIRRILRGRGYGATAAADGAEALALAAEQALKMGPVIDGMYWTLRQPGARMKLSNVESGGLSGVEAAYLLLRSRVGEILSGIHAGRFAPQPPHDHPRIR